MTIEIIGLYISRTVSVNFACLNKQRSAIKQTSYRGIGLILIIPSILSKFGTNRSVKNLLRDADIRYQRIHSTNH